MLNKKALAASLSAPPATYVEDVFSTYLYSGTGSTQSINNGIDLSGEGGLVWLKARTQQQSNETYGGHALYDTVRGATKELSTSNSAAQTTQSTGLTSFNSSGFSIGSLVKINNSSSYNYVSWSFRKKPKFFDIVTYTGNGVSGRTIAHNLESTPGLIIVKETNGSGSFATYHRSRGATKTLLLDSDTSEYTFSNVWNDTEPTSSVFTVGNSSWTNTNGSTYIAYLFAHDDGGFGDSGSESVIKCGSFTTDGSGNATVDLGWEPQWLLRKRTDSTGNWTIVDNMRGFTADGVNSFLYPNLSNAEASSSGSERLTSTGFRLTGFGANIPFIYIAIRRGPMKTPEAGTEVYTGTTRTGTGASAAVTGVGFPPDLVITRNRLSLSSSRFAWYDKLRGVHTFLDSTATNAEFTVQTQSLTSFDQDGETLGTADISNANGDTYINWQLRRAPGFMDVVCYTGTGSARTVTHNLGVAPELMIVKRRDSAENWAVYASGLTDPASWRWLKLNLTDAQSASSAPWDDTAPTSTVFSLSGVQTTVNASGGTYVAYLFATLAGVSKVGSYTGTGTTLQVNCGFTGGARFVMIKRTDSTGDWYVWDTERGIVSGNDPYLRLNSLSAEVTNTDYIDTYSQGFEISSTAPAEINANGGTFIFLAVA